MIINGPSFGLTFGQILWHQWRALLHKGGLLNFTYRPAFFLLWGLLCYALSQQMGLQVLWIPALLNLWFAIELYRRYRLITDTATSYISSSAQGYLELSGSVKLPQAELYPSLPNLPIAAWLPGYVEDEPFYLIDKTGCCLLYPDEAEVIVRPANTPLYWLYAIYPGQTLYVIGDMHTYGGDNMAQTYRERVGELLAQWKSRPLALLEHYDKNNNQRIDPEEWEQVVYTAQQLAAEDIEGEKCQTGTHVINDSSMGRLFLITNIPPHQLAKRYRISSWLHNFIWLLLLFLCQF